MASTTTHRNHEANAAAVGERLAEVLHHHGATADAAASMPEAGWGMAVTLAQLAYPDWRPQPGYSPSPPTRAACLAALRVHDRADADPRLADPFAGFPSL